MRAMVVPGTSGVVGRERSSHKIISESYLLIIAISINLPISTVTICYNIPCISNHMSILNFRVCKVLAH